jgi:hypothetical protein
MRQISTCCFLGFCPVDLHGFRRCKKLQFVNHIVIVPILEGMVCSSHAWFQAAKVLVEMPLCDSELTYVDQSCLSCRCYCSLSAEIILLRSIASLYFNCALLFCEDILVTTCLWMTQKSWNGSAHLPDVTISSSFHQ